MPDVTTALNAATRWLRATPEEVAAVRAYQGLDGGPERLNALLATGAAVPGVSTGTVQRLDGLLGRATLPVDTVIHRGIGDAELVPEEGAVEARPAYVSTSLDETIARRDFAVGPRPVVLDIAVRRGTPGLWVPPLGWRVLAYEREVLLPRGTRIRYGARRMEDGVVLVECEVVP